MYSILLNLYIQMRIRNNIIRDAIDLWVNLIREEPTQRLLCL